MNVIFLTLAKIDNVEERGIYQDLMRKFRDEGHQVYIVCPVERRLGLSSSVVKNKGVRILNVRTLNIQKTNVIEKGIGTLLIEKLYKKTIKKYLPDVKFDLVLYSTPPITFPKVITYLKRKNPQAITYLLLKDIFPQNAVDLGMLVASPKPSPQGKGLKNNVMALPKYLLYRYFRKKEIALYKTSDYIGCMSPANVEYVRKHNTYYPAERVEVAPNSIDVNNNFNLNDNKREIRKKYGLPTDKPIFIYGGNLGKPQGIPFLIKCLEANTRREDCHIVVIGTGTELPKIKAWFNAHHNENHNVTVMEGLPKVEYDQLVRACDVGLIFLDHRFTIPNYPSRLLSYLEYKMPVICATDVNTDIGRIAEENGYGFWCESNSVEAFTSIMDTMIHADRKSMGEKGYEFLKKNYLVENTYRVIVSHIS